MGMSLDDIAGRLEDLALEHDLDELQGLATALSTIESRSCTEECRDIRHKVQMIDRILDELVARDVINPQALLDRQMGRQRNYQTFAAYGNVVSNSSMTLSAGGFLVNTGVV